jgi:hypothetical protein
VSEDNLAADWVLKLRELPCLPDSRGIYRKPPELLRRTRATEPFMDVEPFVGMELDTDANRDFLDLLGVRDQPLDPQAIVTRLRALAGSEEPPVGEVDKWYRRLDLQLPHLTSPELAHLLESFANERLLLTEDGAWALAGEVFRAADDEALPGAQLVRQAVRELTLWRKLGVEERPTAELAVRWLAGLADDVASSDGPLSAGDFKRVRALLARHPERIWQQTGHWLDLRGCWVPVDGLRFALSGGTDTHWKDLHDWVKEQTADLRPVRAELREDAPFNDLSPLASHIENRLAEPTGVVARPAADCDWLNGIGAALTRLKLDTDKTGEDNQASAQILSLARDLYSSSWQTVDNIETVPYLDGTPAGTPRRADVLWADGVFYARELSPGRLVGPLAREVSSAFVPSSLASAVADAVKICFERTEEFVEEYMRENFDLLEVAPSVSGTQEQQGLQPNREPACREEPGAGEESSDIVEFDDNEADDEAEDVAADEPEKLRRKRRRAGPTLMHRFAVIRGYRPDGDGRYSHDDGSSLVRNAGDIFEWEKRSASGEVLACYLPVDQCLEESSLELDAEAWSMISSQPGLYALVVISRDRQPELLRGTDLVELKESGELGLYPASYRLVKRRKGEAA